jgi:hypothetical protein
MVGQQGRGAGRDARVYLDVPYAEKDEAKTHGARWDSTARRWYDPRPMTPGLQRWAALPDVPDLLPGEDRTFGAGLFVDLVPSSCWFTNVRSCVSPLDWDRLRRPILRRAGHQCEICTAPEDRAAGQWLDVHERWHYDEQKGVQALRRLLAVCEACHLATHYGFAQVSSRAEEALAQLIAVTGRSRHQIAEHIDNAFALWDRRSRHAWELDLSMLTVAGISVRRPEPAHLRPAAAERALHAVQTSAPPIPRPREQPPPEPTSPPSTAPAGPPQRGLWSRTAGKA